MLKKMVINLFDNILISASIIHTLHKIIHVLIITTVVLVSNSFENGFINIAIYLTLYGIGAGFFPAIVSKYGYKSGYVRVLILGQILLVLTLFLELKYTSIFFSAIGFTNGCISHIKYYLLSNTKPNNKVSNLNILIFLSIISISVSSLIKTVPIYLLYGIVVSFCLFSLFLINLLVNNFKDEKPQQNSFKYNFVVNSINDFKLEIFYLFASINTIVMMLFMIYMMHIGASYYDLNMAEISSLMLLHMIAMFVPSLVVKSLYNFVNKYILMFGLTFILMVVLLLMVFVKSYELFIFTSIFVGIVWNINYGASIIIFDKFNNDKNKLGMQGKFELCVSLGIIFGVMLKFAHLPLHGIIAFLSTLSGIMLLILLYVKKEITK